VSVSTRIVRIAAGSLPTRLRDRYREQWLADVRDAREQNLRPSQIAVGSLAFAITVGRPLPKKGEPTSAQVDRRARIACGVALSSALLGLSQYASLASGEYLGGNLVPGLLLFVMSTLLIAFAALGSVAALVLVVATRRVSTRIRWAVVLFVAASASPIAQSSIIAGPGVSWNPSLHPSAIAYVVGAVMIATGLVLAHRPRRVGTARTRESVIAGSAVLLVAAAALTNAVTVWSLRAPLLFEAGPRTSGNPIYVQWLHLKEQFEALVSSVFAWWGAGAILLVAVFVAYAIVRRLSSPETIQLAVGVGALVLIAGGALLGFLQLGEASVVPNGEIPVVLTVGRLVLVAAVVSAWRAGVVELGSSGRGARRLAGRRGATKAGSISR
jgi:hypothetical protein